MRFAPDLIEQILSSVPADAWSLPSTYAQTNVHHGYRRIVLVSGGRPTSEAEPFQPILEHFAPVREAWLSWIDPGGFIVAHRDGGPFYERWQVPLRPSGRWGTATTHEVGEPFPVTHWEPHSVTNDAATARVHLVVDRDVIANPEPSPFTLEESHG